MLAVRTALVHRAARLERVHRRRAHGLRDALRRLRLPGQRLPLCRREGPGVRRPLIVGGSHEELVLERQYEPDDEAIARAVAILLLDEAREGEAA